MSTTGRIPKPEVISVRTGNGDVMSEGYYWGEQSSETGWQEIEGAEAVQREQLPAPRPGNAWTKTWTTEGKLYWVEAGAAGVASVAAAKAEKTKNEQERAAHIRLAMQRDLAAPPPPTSDAATAAGPPRGGIVAHAAEAREIPIIGGVLKAGARLTATIGPSVPGVSANKFTLGEVGDDSGPNDVTLLGASITRRTRVGSIKAGAEVFVDSENAVERGGGELVGALNDNFMGPLLDKRRAAIEAATGGGDGGGDP